MRSRTTIVLTTVLVIMASLVWVVARKPAKTSPPVETATALPAVETQQTPEARAQILAALTPPAPAQSAGAATPVASKKSGEQVNRVGVDGVTKHIAQPGETVTSLATDMLGKDTKTNRDAIINANASLKADPDKLMAGKSYRIPSAAEVSAPIPAAVAPEIAAPTTPPAPPRVSEPTASAPPTELKYTAAPGDTVAKLAGAFLGSDSQTNQNAIVNANSSLRVDPDRVVAGQSYRILAPDGLSAATKPSVTEALARPTTQPDADQVVLSGSPRTLRYTARAGDSVTTLAVELLGSDTQAARDAIISNNVDLKRNPDRVVEGQTYWIPAPVADVRTP